MAQALRGTGLMLTTQRPGPGARCSCFSQVDGENELPQVKVAGTYSLSITHWRHASCTSPSKGMPAVGLCSGHSSQPVLPQEAQTELGPCVELETRSICWGDVRSDLT